MRHRLPLLITAALLLLPLACAPGPRGAEAPLSRGAVAGSPVGRALPSVTVATLEGKEARAAALIDGRPAMVVLWATWCEACVEELPSLHRLAPRARAGAAVLLSLSVGEPRDKVAEFVRREAMDWPQLVDEPFHFADAAGQSRVPAVLVVAADGTVVFAGGKLDEAAIAALGGEIERARSRATRGPMVLPPVGQGDLK